MELRLDGKGILFSTLSVTVFISCVLIRSVEGLSTSSQFGLLLSVPILSPNFIHKALGCKNHPAPCVHAPSP